MREQRVHERIDVAIEIRVNWMEKGQEVTTTCNYSDGGALVKNPFNEIPVTGTPMTLQATNLVMGNAAPVLSAQVVRANEDLIAYKFTFDSD